MELISYSGGMNVDDNIMLWLVVAADGWSSSLLLLVLSKRYLVRFSEFDAEWGASGVDDDVANDVADGLVVDVAAMIIGVWGRLTFHL